MKKWRRIFKVIILVWLNLSVIVFSLLIILYWWSTTVRIAYCRIRYLLNFCLLLIKRMLLSLHSYNTQLCWIRNAIWSLPHRIFHANFICYFTLYWFIQITSFLFHIKFFLPNKFIRFLLNWCWIRNRKLLRRISPDMWRWKLSIKFVSSHQISISFI